MCILLANPNLHTWHYIIFCLLTGEINLGEPCVPYTITQAQNGTQQVQGVIHGWKIPFLQICKQALEDHFQYMRLSNWANVLTASRAQLERLVEEEV